MNKIFLTGTILAIALTLGNGQIYGTQTSPEQTYREKVFLHLGRNTFISGESIWFKAYCFNATDTKAAVSSKVLYVELIDRNRKHILGNILEISDGSACSSMVIPDSLSSGTYEIKAYTNWMRNFNSEDFYSSNIYIQNPFTDVSLKNFSYSNNEEIRVYIEGGNLTDGIYNNVAIKLPFVPKGRISGKIVDGNNNLCDSNIFDSKGLAVFHLVPAGGKSYHCIISGGCFNDQQINFPTIANSGYQISLDKKSNSGIIYIVTASHASTEKLKVEVYSNEIKIKELPLKNFSNSIPFEISNESVGNGLINIQLKDIKGNILAYNFFNTGKSTNLLRVNSIKSIYKSREKVSLNISADRNLIDSSGTYSISVARQSPIHSAIYDEDMVSSLLAPSHVHSFANFCDSSGITHFLSEAESESLNNYNYNSLEKNGAEYQYPIEDIGNLYLGRCINSKSNLPANKIKVLISVIDSVPSVQASLSGADGNFAFLLKGYGVKNVFMQPYRNDTLVDNEIKIILENKYHFSNTNDSLKMENWTIKDSLFQIFMEDEIKRVEIERAFEIKSDQPKLKEISEQKSHAFYGQPEYSIKLDDYIFLSNFQEIINEIVTYTKYNKKHKDCEISVFNPDYNIYYDNPIILVDGIPVNNLCLLYSLNSNDIERIEVQNHERLAGNMIYKGLVSIYLKGNTKKFHNLLVPENKLTALDGYQNEIDFVTTDFGGTLSMSDNRPYFRNQLYWNPSLKMSKTGNNEIDFFTSDEEGEYLIDIQGMDAKGNPIHFQKTFLVNNQSAK